MSNIPDDLKYASTHEWISVNEDGLVTVGISDHAQEALGDIVFVELPEAGASVNFKEEVGIFIVSSRPKCNPEMNRNNAKHKVG